MQIIRHIFRHPPFPHPVVSLGNFDGIHLGHQAIVKRVVAEAQKRQGTATVVTFYPHPLAVLRPSHPPALILSVREKLSVLASLGVEVLYLKRFSVPFSSLSPEAFVQRYLVEAIGAEKIIVGHNVSFGRNRTGRAETLEQLGRTFGVDVEIVGPIRVEGNEVSSSAVRSRLAAGEMRAVTQLLGRLYAVSGRVEKGFQRGRGLGFPTANLRPRADVLLPHGVYAVVVEVGKQHVPGVANVGINPTFGGNTRTIEAHLFDFSADLYGQRVRVGFVERLRGERKFPTVQDLARQIQADAARARALLSQEGGGCGDGK